MSVELLRDPKASSPSSRFKPADFGRSRLVNDTDSLYACSLMGGMESLAKRMCDLVFWKGAPLQSLRICTCKTCHVAAGDNPSGCFPGEYGVSPHQYRQRYLMQRACTLLLNRRLSVKETAAMLGFCDEFHFSRLFKKVTGRPPSALVTGSLD